MRLRLAAAFAAAALLVVADSAGAQQYPPSKVFVTVDSVQLEGIRLWVTGIVQGDPVPTTWSLQAPSATSSHQDPNTIANCQQMALLAMTKPGQYLFGLSISSTSYLGCKLTRVAP